jgi:two-component system response regulator NreC
MNECSKRILLADDHAVVRRGLAAIIGRYTSHKVVAEVGDGFETIDGAIKHKPDLVILDIGMPGLNGLETISQMRQKVPKTKILVLSMHQDKRFVASAIRRGASGYLLKDGAVEELIGAIQRIMNGQRYISPVLSDVVADELMNPDRKEIKSGIEELSTRERQILSFVAAGTSRSEIAKRLHISPETVKTHRRNIMAKLHFHSQSDMVKFAIANNLGPIS